MLILLLGLAASAAFGQKSVLPLQESSPAVPAQPKPAARQYAAHSVLASGTWFKVGVTKTGIHKIGYADLVAMGISPASVNPSAIGIFGSNGTMLPELNSAPRNDDLRELAVEVTGSADGRFDASDQVLFYASGPVTWQNNTDRQLWEHTTHLYSDTIYYFLTTDKGQRRVLPAQPADSGPTVRFSSYDYPAVAEEDKINLLASGRQWYGQVFDLVTARQIPFDIPALAAGGNIKARSVTAAKSSGPSSFTFSVGTQSWTALHAPVSNFANSPVATLSKAYATFGNVQLPLRVNVQYNKSVQGATGYLDFIEINASCALNFTGDQMIIREAPAPEKGMIYEYELKNAAGKARIWNVSNCCEPAEVLASANGNDLVFKAPADEQPVFAAFDDSHFLKPAFAGRVPNQDLHGMAPAAMIIVAPKLFQSQASRLAAFHAAGSGLSVAVCQPDDIYNEFSSGTPDITALRDFMKMLYNRYQGENAPRYLLLFGDASYDYRGISGPGNDLVPAWQSSESLDPVLSSMSDDYYGLLDENEGSMYMDVIDIGIGRLPVKTVAEAETAVDKIIHYSSPGNAAKGDWQNVVTLVADDENENEHIENSEIIAGRIEKSDAGINIDKIYLDAYQQVTTPTGDRYPDVNKAITQRMEKGCLIINYIGHGGETGWAHEKVLTIPEINTWSNYDRLPVFITATCEFSRFDNPELVSAGELAFLNPKGGAIALFTTTRPTYGTQNFELNQKFYQYAIGSTSDRQQRLGDILLRSKRDAGSNDNGRKYVLLGDPALRLALPALNIITTAVNGKPVSDTPDTLKAMMPVTVEGIITNDSGELISDFNGTVLPTVYDRVVPGHTLSNDGEGSYTFSLRKNMLYKGKVTAENGRFRFTFMVPRDISYSFGSGKISYYASDSLRDASGSYSNLQVGGVFAANQNDNSGPAIALYMNDLRFSNGGITNQNPHLIVRLSDESGINTSGTGIGHDITAVLDNNFNEPYILNAFFVSDLNTYQSGTIRFPFTFLPAGEHTLTIKAWDNANNSSEAVIRFKVQHSGELIVSNSRNYPNPFTRFTDFIFEHNQQNTAFAITTEIYSLSGVQVKIIQTFAEQPGSVSLPVRWDGTDNAGNPVKSGMYIYRMKISSSNGLFTETFGKMIYNK